MAQEIMWDFNADDKTLWLNNEKMGLFYSGVQKGFKVIRGSNAGMNFSFLHDFPKPGESILDGTDGATNAANRLTSATSDFSAYAVGDVLEVFDRTSTGDNGLYIITTVAPGGNVTQIDVHRNFPTGSLANLRFRVYTPVGVILTEDHAVVREFGCQDNVDALANGGGSLRHDVIFARYIYNASSPPNTCSYLKASCTSLVTGADGSATPNGKLFFSGGSTFVTSGVEPGDILRINDTGLPYQNGEYVVVEVASETDLYITDSFPYKGSTSGPLDFEVYSLPALTEKDTIIAMVDVPAGTVDFDDCFVRRPDYLHTISDNPYRVHPSLSMEGRLPTRDPQGNYLYGGFTLSESGGSVSLVNGSAVTKGGVVVDEFDSGVPAALVPALSAAGKHRISKVVYIRKDDRKLDHPVSGELLEIAGSEVLTTVVPVSPTESDIMTAVQVAYPDDVWRYEDYFVVGELYVTDADIRVFGSVPSWSHGQDVHVYDEYGELEASYGGAYAIDDAINGIQYRRNLQFIADESVDISEVTKRIRVTGDYLIPSDLHIPSRVWIDGPAHFNGSNDIVQGGRSVIGNHVAATWTAALLPDPSSLPAGHKLYEIAINPAYQTGYDFNEMNFTYRDPVELYDNVTGTLFEGYLYSVASSWTVYIIIPNTYNPVNDTGSVRVLKHHNKLTGIGYDGDCYLEHAVSCVQDACLWTNLYLQQHIECAVDCRIEVGNMVWNAYVGFDSDFANARKNLYRVAASTDLNVSYADTEEDSKFSHVIQSTTAASTSSLRGTRVDYGTVQFIDDSSGGVGNTLNINGTGLSVGVISAESSTVVILTGASDVTIGRVVATLFRLDDPCSDIVVLSHSVTTLTNNSTAYTLVLQELDEREDVDRNLIPSSAGSFSWSLSTNTLTWDDTLYLSYIDTVGRGTIVAGSAVIPDLSCVVVEIDRTIAVDTAVVPSVTTLAAASSGILRRNTLVIAYRIHDNVYLLDGTVVENGATVQFGQTLPPDGSITWAKLAPSAKEFSVDGLGQYRGDLEDYGLSVDVPFYNTTSMAFAYDGVNTITFAGAPDLSRVEQNDVFIDTRGYRHKVVGVSDVADTITVPDGSSVNTAAAASPWHGSVVRGNLHYRNVGLIDYTFSVEEVSAADGVSQSAANNQFDSAGGGFSVLTPGAELIVADVGSPGCNGIYRVTVVDSDTRVTVDRDFPAGLAALTFVLRQGKVTWASLPRLPFSASPGITSNYLIRDSSGEYHRIDGIATSGNDNNIAIDYRSNFDDTTPAVSSDGALYTDNNPRGLRFGDIRPCIGVERCRVSGVRQSKSASPLSLYGNTNSRGRTQMFVDPRDERFAFYGNWSMETDSQSATFIHSGDVPSAVEFTFFGSGAIPLIKATTAGLSAVKLYMDGRRISSTIDLDPTDTLGDTLMSVQKYKTPNGRGISDYNQILGEVGVHTVRLVFDSDAAGSDAPLLYGFDVIHEFTEQTATYDWMVAQSGGVAYVDGKRVDVTSNLTLSIRGTETGWKGGTILGTLKTDGTVQRYDVDVPDLTSKAGSFLAVSDTVSGMADPEAEGYRVGDIVRVVDSLGLEEIFMLDAVGTNSVSTDRDLDANGILTPGNCTVYYYGYSYLSCVTRPEPPTRKIDFHIDSMGSGDATDNDFLAVGLTTMHYTASDNSTVMSCDNGVISINSASSLDGDDSKLTLIDSDAAKGIIIGFYGTGLDIHLPYDDQYVDTTLLLFDLYVDNQVIGSFSMTEIRSGVLRACGDLPMGYHTVAVYPTTAGGGDDVFSMTGFTVYQLDYETSYDGVPIFVADQPANAYLHYQDTILDPGRGWERHYPNRECFVEAGTITESEAFSYRAGAAVSLGGVGAIVVFMYYGKDIVVRGTAGNSSITIDGAAGTWNAVNNVPLGYHCVEIEQTGAGTPIIECFDVEALTTTYRSLKDSSVVGNNAYEFSSALGLLTRATPLIDQGTSLASNHAEAAVVQLFDQERKVRNSFLTVSSQYASVYAASISVHVACTTNDNKYFYLRLVVDGKICRSFIEYSRLTSIESRHHATVYVDLPPGEHTIGWLIYPETGAGDIIQLFDVTTQVTSVSRIRTLDAY